MPGLKIMIGVVDDEQNRYFFVNVITKERRPLTKAQYRDSNYTLNER